MGIQLVLRKHWAIAVGVLIILISAATLVIARGRLSPEEAGFANLKGTLTIPKPECCDKFEYWKIDDTSFLVGGGLAGVSPEEGAIEDGLKSGDRVEARLRKENDNLTLIGCSSCYVRHQRGFMKPGGDVYH